MCKKLLALVGLLSGSLLAQATPVTIPDYSFEGITTSISSPNNLTIATNTGAIGSWSAYAAGLVGFNSSIASGTTNSLGAPIGADGSYVLSINLPAGAGASAGLNQTLSDTFLANSIYTLSFEIDGGTAVTLLSGSSLSLWAGSMEVTNLSGANFVSLLDGNGDFQTLTLTYETDNSPPSGNIGIAFDANSVAGANGNIFLDNFQLDASPVPEPGTWALGGLGLFLMAIGWRRNKNLKASSFGKD